MYSRYYQVMEQLQDNLEKYEQIQESIGTLSITPVCGTYTIMYVCVCVAEVMLEIHQPDKPARFEHST